MTKRITKSDCLELLKDVPLGTLMQMAHKERLKRHPDKIVTFVKDTNPNYTNVCATKCSFCAFCRDEDDKDAYTLTPDELAEKVCYAQSHGATTVLMQGGHNPKVMLNDWIAYINAIKEKAPQVHVHPFSPPEIIDMAAKEGCSTKDVLEALKESGIDTIPGGGAEVLSDSVRSKLAPNKCSARQWLDLMEEAHNLGFRTTATMMYGHIESNDDIVEHLFGLRELQDRTGGFSSFIPWSFKPGNSKLSEKVKTPAHPGQYVRLIAVTRLVLDNFDHVQSSWFSESEKAGILGLIAGADDFGGILIEENVLKTSGYKKSTTVEKVKSLIRAAGFTPAQRDSYYNVIEVFN